MGIQKLRRVFPYKTRMALCRTTTDGWVVVGGVGVGWGGRKMDKVSGHLVVENPSYFIILQYKLNTQLNKEYFVLRDFLILTVLLLNEYNCKSSSLQNFQLTFRLQATTAELFL